MRGRHSGRIPSERRPCVAVARAIRPTVAVATSKLTMMALALVMFLCWTSSVLGKEVKGLGFYPPFQTFNARGRIIMHAPSFSADKQCCCASMSLWCPYYTVVLRTAVVPICSGRLRPHVPKAPFSLVQTLLRRASIFSSLCYANRIPSVVL